MSLASSFKTAAWLSALVAIIGCGSSTSPSTGGFGGGNGSSNGGFSNNGANGDFDATAGGDDSGGYASSSSSGGGLSSGNTASSGGSSTCVSTCTQDSDCQNSCGTPPAGGIYCCDTSTGCFASQMAACPSQPVGAAE